ncbi:3-hydroxyacyl-CoA dehydrogenase [Streptomyces sp. MNU77]|uniref:SDR family NAD(P)-dependent oxidoreductase n=1 Tax=Streptomyces sp. MNU77 TaxID=1573406 RepID=UPI0005DA721C|nr:SDR family NAD(P)-dependent oxidoreductase [Streptomyces sp. MNU77]OLO25793.1 3-hydroxyacyl-CoA dehydrogenase [Streptomyces sp. MNU77]
MLIDRETVALVTGGASGLGAAVAADLRDRGARVVVGDLSEKGAPEGCVTVRTDVTSEESVAATVRAAAGLGPLRVVVNTAGIGPAGRVLSRRGVLPLAGFARVIDVNLVGTFNVLRLAAEAMAENEPLAGERGVVVNTASIAAFDGQIGQAAYSASKGGIAALTLPAARDLAQHLIRVMTVAPGTFDTPLLDGVPDEARASLGSQVPHPSRLGRPEEFAALVGHIVQNPMLNGEVIRLDGALRMAPR